MSEIIKKSDNSDTFGISKQTSMNALIVASMLALSMNGAYAAEDNSIISETNNAAKDNVNTTKVVTNDINSGNVYTLTKIQIGGEPPERSDLVVKFEYNQKTDKIEPVYYALTLKDSIKTIGQGSETDNVDLYLNSEVPFDSINIKYNNTSAEQPVEHKISDGEISISDNFIGLDRTITSYDDGGMVINSGKIDNVSGDFISNSFNANTYHETGGGALSNVGENAKINSITGNYYNNIAYSSKSFISGGAIYNAENALIDRISGNFIQNTVSSSSTNSYRNAMGGAIANESQINTINGLFANNFATSSYKGNAEGGAIYNSGLIDNINGVFINNYVSAEDPYGGAIYNTGVINSITGDFISNRVVNNTEESTFEAGSRYYFNSSMSGGAIYNSQSINKISANFVSNSAFMGGAIFTEGYSANTNVNSSKFINNTANFGGAIALYKQPYLDSYEENDALYLNIENSIFTSNISESGGGALALILDSYNNTPLSKTFSSSTNISNSYFEGNAGDIGGAILLNKNTSYNMPGPASLLDNTSMYRDSSSAALDKYLGYDLKISNSTFKNNIASEGGAIGILSTTKPQYNAVEALKASNGLTIGVVNFKLVDEENNVIKDFGSHYAAMGIENIGCLINTNPAHVQIKDSLFNGNLAKNMYGGAISIRSDSRDDIDINYVGEKDITFSITDKPEDISLEEYIENIQYDIDSSINDHILFTSEDGLNEYYGGLLNTDNNALELVNTSFVNNKAESDTWYEPAHGGAIYSNSNLKISANSGTSLFSGNKVVTPTEDGSISSVNEAIYLDNNNIYNFDFNEIPRINLTLEAKNNGLVQFDDKINGSYSYNLHITGDKTGTVRLNNDVKAEYPIIVAKLDANSDDSEHEYMPVYIDLEKTTLHLGVRDNVLDGNNLTLNSGTINMVNNQVGVSLLNNLTLGGDTNMVADVDLSKAEMDRFTAESYGKEESQEKPLSLVKNGTHSGNLHVVGFNMLSDAPENQDVTEIYFAQVGLKDNVVNGVKETPTSYQTTAYTPIYKYNVMYDNREDAGYFLFTKGDKVFTPGGGTEGTGNPSDAFNPSVLSSPVAAQAGAYAAQNAAFSYAFQHADSFMPLPASERFAIRNTNRYAINETSGFETRLNDLHDKAIWVRPYTSFENIPLKNGPKVDTITYGTLVGGDSQIKELRNGWGTVFTGYMGYNGSSQSYSGVNTYQNGGLLGATQTFYKKNFFTALTASVGASAAM